MNIKSLAMAMTVLLSAIWCSKAQACGMCTPTYNYYMFRVTDVDSDYQSHHALQERLRAEWSKYVGHEVELSMSNVLQELSVDNIDTSDNDIVEHARNTKDTKMLKYLKHLATYLEVARLYDNPWYYNDGSDGGEETLKGLYNEISNTSVTGLENRYTLLKMRILFRLGNYDECLSVMKGIDVPIGKDVFIDMAYGFMAGALFRTNRREEAAEYYALLGDMRSAKACMNGMHNVSCMRAVIKKNPNSPLLTIMLDDLINSIQETHDCLRAATIVKQLSLVKNLPITDLYAALPTYRGLDYDTDDAYEHITTLRPLNTNEWFADLATYFVQRNAIDELIDLTIEMAAKKEVKDKQMWVAARAYLHFLDGDNSKAYKVICDAMNMHGGKATAETTRCLRMLIVTGTNNEKEIEKVMMADMPWLMECIQRTKKYEDHLNNDLEKYGDDEHGKEINNLYYDQPTRSLQRIVFHGLMPYFHKKGDKSMELACLKIVEGTDEYIEEGSSKPYLYYGSEYISAMHKMSLSELKDYYNFLFTTANHTELEKLIIKNGKHENELYEDFIGTRCLQLAQWQEAQEWLSKVSLEFLSRQAIAAYTVPRRYSLDRWFSHIEVEEPEYGTSVALSMNKKLEFAKDMVDLEKKYASTTGEQRYVLAYTLASRYFQASPAGDCWWLTNYGVHNDGTAMNEYNAECLDFKQKAYDLLGEAKGTSNKELLGKVLYARLFIPIDPYYSVEYDWETDVTMFKPNKQSRQYLVDLTSLRQYCLAMGSHVPYYISQCDILNAMP